MEAETTFMGGGVSNLTFQLGADAEEGGSHGVSSIWSRIAWFTLMGSCLSSSQSSYSGSIIRDTFIFGATYCFVAPCFSGPSLRITIIANRSIAFFLAESKPHKIWTKFDSRSFSIVLWYWTQSESFRFHSWSGTRLPRNLRVLLGV